MTWWRTLRRRTRLPILADPDPPWVPPPFAYGDQLLSPAQRRRKWEANARRQDAEAREEAELQRQRAEHFAELVRRHPNRAYFPDAQSGPWLEGQDLLEYLSNPSHWRRSR